MPSLEQTIRTQYDLLPTGERRLADVVLASGCDLGPYSATELAQTAGVSKATASRLVRHLGFDDYQQMRRQARASAGAGSPLGALRGGPAQPGTLGQHLDHDIACLTHTLGGVSADLISDAVGLLTKAARIWIVGFRNSYVLALYARELLVQVKPDVRLLPVPGQTLAEELSALAAEDVVLALGFRRRPPGFAQILRVAAQAGARTILIGDPSVGGLGKHAAVTLPCLSRGSGLFDTYVAPISLLNFLCARVAVGLGDAALKRRRHSEVLHDRLGDFGL